MLRQRVQRAERGLCRPTPSWYEDSSPFSLQPSHAQARSKLSISGRDQERRILWSTASSALWKGGHQRHSHVLNVGPSRPKELECASYELQMHKVGYLCSKFAKKLCNDLHKTIKCELELLNEEKIIICEYLCAKPIGHFVMVKQDQNFEFLCLYLIFLYWSASSLYSQFFNMIN